MDVIELEWAMKGVPREVSQFFPPYLIFFYRHSTVEDIGKETEVYPLLKVYCGTNPE